MGVRDSYLWGLVILTFRGYEFLRLGVSFCTFGGLFSYVWGLVFLTFGD